ncbi:TPA: HTH domain-containing protein [Enterococcus faecium]|nr:HTH domain-containing protein [Enterococcus faecium]HAQ3732769.1 HTH domain-containing protein [Enterococcus faecium]HAQ3738678.1 HTH domain-containing protein [Enterococcus faecium]HAQ3741317.1 HTH domain-containing protein [Enterococcus faecium]HAQ3752963.1 HTH domain-containing protein [Enterococcus faecium]
MYSLMKKIITEKDIRRHVSLVEQLLNHTKITVNELAEIIGTTERTIFSDLQSIRSQLPEGWDIISDQAGISLQNQQNLLTNDLWEIFFKQSVSVELLKNLLFTKKVAVPDFLADHGLSYGTLKRHVTKINQRLASYDLQIDLTKYTACILGKERAIRTFYHRLLIPFTHNNYFFEDYSIHTNSTLSSLYDSALKKLYLTEGIYLKDTELSFASFCFLESWNYNNNYGQETARCLHHSPFLEVLETFVEELASELSLDQLKKTSLTDNLALLILKYHESPILIEALDRQYHRFLETYDQQYAHLYQQKENLLNDLKKEIEINEPNYFLQLLSLLIQQTIFSIKPNLFNVYFIFQGEPSWKAFLQQELKDYLGKRVCFLPIELTDLSTISFEKTDILISNFPLDSLDIPIVYISSIPTKNELNRLTELTFKTFL